MDASGILSVKSQMKCRSIGTALASAVLEWFLICLLFIEAFFSYLITKFACYYKLQTPCLLCTRLDHILGNKKLKYYCDLMCGKHKLEISSLVLCHAHNKLADVHGMCERCLFSFATINKSNAETYRLLVGKLGEGCGFGSNEDHLLGDHTPRTQYCSCCDEPWIPKGYGQSLMQNDIIGSEAAEFDARLSAAAEFDARLSAAAEFDACLSGTAVCVQENSHKIERSIPVIVTRERSIIEFDSLPHIGYTELKVNSDTESEVLFSDDDDNANAQSRAINPEEDVSVRCVQTEPQIISLHDDPTSENLIDSVAALQTPISIPHLQSAFVNFHDITSISPIISIGHGLEELQWQQADNKFDPSAVPELISLDEISPSSIAKETPVEEAKGIDHSSVDGVIPSLDAKETPVEEPKGIDHSSIHGVTPSLNAKETPVEEPKGIDHSSVDGVTPSLDAKETPVEEPKGIDHSSVDGVTPSLDAKETLVEEPKEIDLSSVDGVTPSLDAKETPVEEPKGIDHSSVDGVTPSLDAKETPVEEPKGIDHSSVDGVTPLLDSKETLEEASKESILAAEDILIPPPSVARETPVEDTESSKLTSVDDVHPKSDRKPPLTLISTGSQLISLVDFLPSSGGAETPIQGLQGSCFTKSEEIWETAVTDGEEISKMGNRSATVNETASETNIVSGDNGHQAPNLLELGDAYKLAIGNRGRQFSGALAEQWIGKDSSRLTDDLRILFSQVSSARELTMNDASPRVPVSPHLSSLSDETKNLDSSNAIGIHLLQRRISLERNESGLSMDGSIVGEIEGESAVDRLKRQIEHDKKLLTALYKEVEEERNASAVSTNQAMAMITRLQEEKATLQMEALQYLRMMEEQSEYDMEALQRTNDLLSEREKEIQDLQAEIEFYRNNQSELLWENPDNSHQVRGRHMSSADKNVGTSVDNAVLNFDDEREYILECLKKLENRIFLYSNNQINMVNGEHTGNEVNAVNSKLGFQINCEVDENDKGNGPESIEKSDLIRNAYNEMFHSGQSTPLPTGGVDLDLLADEVSDLNERLKALESDRSFIEHSINSIRIGDEGLQFIEEIAAYLKELRSIRIRGTD
ncbi:myosin-binding protein 1 [Mercurialis annua]|uniref:myosin-binding protein 1 n=1 Tax=Mercurialis annua TaxID=3986 RepID=UPI002160E6F4|nr:myosin-binding protein 1 [Mercurialis annua]